MRLITSILIVLSCSLPSQAVEIDVPNRMQNRGNGICFWACTESIGKQLKMPTLLGLCDDVMQYDIGRDNGADRTSIIYWSFVRDIPYKWIEKEGLQDLHERVKTQHTIAIMQPWLRAGDTVAHAIVPLKISEQPSYNTDADGRMYYDYWVTYYDPNTPEVDWLLPWSYFRKIYHGCYVVSH